jgi:predicted SprT family Zn-dependent metalloprotease
MRRLGALWKAPALAGISVTLNPRLSRTLGRLLARPWRIELGRRALVGSKRLREVVTHEGAHAALALKAGPTPAPHGPEWRRLMALAGYPQATGAHWRCDGPSGQSRQQKQQPNPKTQPAVAYDHWCPVCQSSRQGRRPVKAWPCAALPERLISTGEVEDVVLHGDILEDYPDDVRGHSCLLMGTPLGRPVHVVCSPRAEYLAIIAAYLPDLAKWSPDFRRRID